MYSVATSDAHWYVEGLKLQPSQQTPVLQAHVHDGA
jgi:hypothetical protein